MSEEDIDFDNPTDEADSDPDSAIKPEASEEEEQEKADRAIIERAKRNFKLAEEATREIRKEALDDLKFRAGDQWDDEIRNSRTRDKRPCLTFNRLPQFSNQVVNDIRQNRPSTLVSPTGDGASEDTAEIFEGLVRHIETASDADIATDVAVEMQVIIGFGYERIVTEYASEMSFDLEARVKQIPNPFSVHTDVSSIEPDGKDLNWGHIFDDLTRAEFKAQFPKAKLSQIDDWDSIGANQEGWVTTEGCRITEYFEKEFRSAELYLLSDGSTILKEDLPEPPAVLPNDVGLVRGSDGQPICRETLIPKVMWYKMTGIEILERQEFPSKYIPIIPYYGSRFMIEGERKIEGITRHAKDPQRMYNYMRSAEVEMIGLAPKAPYIGAEGQFEGHEENWETANTENHPYLEYNETTIDGKPVGPPQRQQFDPAIQTIVQSGAASAEDMKATTGIYDPSLGNRSNEVSGRAIERRTAQAQTSNYHFAGNAKRSIRHRGRILVDMIPRVYDTARTIRIIDAENEPQIVKINQIFMEEGSTEPKIHRMNVGTYEVAIDEGPSYKTKRQEFVTSVLELVSRNPKLWDQIGDLLVKNMDWPGARAIADRLKKFLPPQLQDDQTPIPPQAQQQIAQLTQLSQQLTAQLNEKTQIINTKKMELESKERMKYEELLADFRLMVMKLDAEHAQTAFTEELKLLKAKLDMFPASPAFDPNAGGPAAAPSAPNEPQPMSTGGQPPGSNPME